MGQVQLNKKETGWVLTEDKKRIVFDYYKNGHSKVVVLAHGFYNNKDAYLFKKISKMFARKYDVLSFDFRGHGKSEGLFSWTTEEAKDIRGICNFAKQKEYESIGVVGFSLGAAITLIEAASNKDIKSVIAVSSPYDFWQINFHFWEEEMLNDLKLNLGPRGKGKGVRPGNPFGVKVRPIDIVSQISPTSVLFLHGDKDWLIKPDHSRKLFEKAKEPKALEIVKNAGHAEKIFDDYPEIFEKICAEWFEKTM